MSIKDKPLNIRITNPETGKTVTGIMYICEIDMVDDDAYYATVGLDQINLDELH